jgi:hypothetical protein
MLPSAPSPSAIQRAEFSGWLDIGSMELKVSDNVASFGVYFELANIHSMCPWLTWLFVNKH